MAWCNTIPNAGISLQNSSSSGLSFSIVTMGASIAYGLLSADANGFRLGLQDLLRANGTQTTMVGTQWSGNMTDNHHEAYPGVKISELNNLTYHSGVYDMAPNVILINVGTNDCWWVQGENGTGAATRYSYLLDSISARAPGALVLPSTLIPSTNPTQDQCIRDVNSALRPVVEVAAGKGQHARLVEMYDVVPLDQMAEDGTHPTDLGYQLMARQWYEAIYNATQALCPKEDFVAEAAASASAAAASAAATSSAANPSSSSSKTVSAATTLSLQKTLWLLMGVATWVIIA
ncbi:hypothetical protein LTR78_006926 [Recurvomyces mirabilis]|uniref:SGNH hydrolase-type esterase domain-containing protein n=1 Tax=Recurvomyces mirabilis TaxID=574656 RepID=A0AAE1BZ25_9PEZI|nr:hypothetical protein LTR78_006926 [Recurvomyces mirabilis]KAK5153310.1 hypothetical protein LTS14_007479 [Recurvomyces mirabilis]